MCPHSRRRILTGVSSLIILSGCSQTGLEDSESPSSDETTISVSSSSKTRSEMKESTPDMFDNLDIETDQTWCPKSDHWEPNYHRTPMPPPARPSNLTQQATVEYVKSYESYVLTYMAVNEFGPQTPSPPTPTNRPEILEFPDTEIQNSSITILDDFKDGFVVQISYSRLIEEDFKGEFTVNYYVSPEYTIRAEEDGDISPGPNPTRSGTILRC